MSKDSIAPIRKEFLVKASQEKTFRTFTERIDAWWPRAHHIGASPLKREVIEGRTGGRWYGLSEDGTECNVGKVLVWDPFFKVLLTWQITADWKYDPDFVTEVEVQFIEKEPKLTLVKFEHRQLDRYGDAAAATRNSLDAKDGWNGNLDAFRALAEGEAQQ